MVKKRLIFTLLYEDRQFFLSRNFRLQRVGDINWLLKNYNFEKIATSIDELIILNISRQKHNFESFCEDILVLTKNCFLPISLGGGIRNIRDASILFRNGADKVVINSSLFNNPNLVKDLASIYGNQSIIASVDFKIIDKNYDVFIENGSKKISTNLHKFLLKVMSLPVGELYLNSIDQDGTGQGLLIKSLNEIPKEFNLPIILSGGAGNKFHLYEALKISETDAVATANLFNFIGDGLPNARNFLLEKGCKLAKW